MKGRACICLALLLAGCAGPQVTALDVEIAKAQAEAARACYAATAVPDYADARDVALAAMARALSGDPCKQTNVYDGRAAIAASQNRAVGAAVSGAVLGVGIVAGADVLKTAFRQSGNITNTNIAGDNNSAAHYDTRSSVSNRQQGEGASMSAPATGAETTQGDGPPTGPPPHAGGQGGGQGATP